MGANRTAGATNQSVYTFSIHKTSLLSQMVRLKLYKGNVIVVGRSSDDSLFDEEIATFEEDAGAYDQADAAGFIKLNALRLRLAAQKGRK